VPVIRIASVRSQQQSANDWAQGHPAAAAMAVALAKTSEPFRSLAVKGQMQRAERPLLKNPNKLTLRQHIFPKRSMEPFADQSGRVTVFDVLRHKARPAKLDDTLFLAQRAWDQRTETYMKHIEDKFQRVVRPIIECHVNTITPEQRGPTNSMFALWFMRARYRQLGAQEIELFGVTGDHLTKAQEETLEKNGYLFARRGGKMPARQLNGVQLQMRINRYALDLSAVTKWGAIHAQSGEFIVPDVPSHMIIPLTPKLALVGSATDGIITEQNVAEINSAVKAGSREYYFARDLAKCPF